MLLLLNKKSLLKTKKRKKNEVFVKKKKLNGFDPKGVRNFLLIPNLTLLTVRGRKIKFIDKFQKREIEIEMSFLIVENRG